MSRDANEPEGMRDLFERSAGEPDPLALARLRNAAREVPQRARRRSALPAWTWTAGFAALSALAVLLVLSRRAPSADDRTRAAVRPLLSAPRAQGSDMTALAPSAEPAAPMPGDSQELAATEELTNSEDGEDSGEANLFDDLALDPGDLPDAEIDAWISAANTLLDG